MDTVLITRKLFILKTGKKDETAKKLIPLYVYCTVIFFLSSFGPRAESYQCHALRLSPCEQPPDIDPG